MELTKTERLLASLMVIGFIGAATPAHFRISESFSLQSLWTVTALACLMIVVWQSRELIPTTEKSLFFGAFVLLLAQGAFALFTHQSPRAYNYLFAVPLAFGGFLLGTNTDFGRSWRRIAYPSAIAVCFMAPIFQFLRITGDSRVMQATLAFAVIIIASQVLTQSSKQFIGFTSIVVASAVCFLDGARVASFLILSASVPLVYRLVREHQLWAYFLGGAQLALLMTSFFWNTRSQPFLGGDNGLAVGSLAVNTTGRSTLASRNLEAVLDSSQDLWKVSFGRGIGHSREISLAALGSETPLNEFIRVFSDLGLFGITVLAASIFALIMMIVHLLRFYFYAKALEASLMLMSLIMFSLTENMLSYSWILLPVFTVLGSLNAAISHRESRFGHDPSACP